MENSLEESIEISGNSLIEHVDQDPFQKFMGDTTNEEFDSGMLDAYGVPLKEESTLSGQAA